MRLILGGWGVVILATLTLLGGQGCSSATDPWQDQPGEPRVVVTIAPLYSFVRAVAGEDVPIKCLCTTTGPHHYQIDTRDARLFARADVFFAVGLKLDTFADTLRTMAKRPDLRTIKLGGKLPDKNLLELKHEHNHDAGGEHHHHGKWDPHVWLGIDEVVEMVGEISLQLGAVDGKNSAVYQKNAEAYIERLRRLHAEGKKALEGKKVKRIVSFHEALGYFARSFGLEIADVIETGPGDEPSAGHLKHIVEICQDAKRPIGAITVEPQYPRSTSAVIVQRELKAKGLKIDLIEIDPLETAEVAELEREGAAWYETRMRKNIQNLASKLP